MSINFNGKQYKELRDDLAIWSITKKECADTRITKSTRVNNYKGMIATDLDFIERMEKGEKIMGEKSIDELKAEIADFNKRIEDEQERSRKFVAEHASATKRLYDRMVTTGLANAITGYAANRFDDKANTMLQTALMEFFATDNAEDVLEFMNSAMAAAKVNSDRALCQTDTHNGTLKGVKALDAFLGDIVKYPALAKMLPIYKWTNIIEAKSKK